MLVIATFSGLLRLAGRVTGLRWDLVWSGFYEVTARSVSTRWNDRPLDDRSTARTPIPLGQS